MSRQVKRVPLDFAWPLKQTWGGYVNPFAWACGKCPDCDGSGYAPDAKRFGDEWYGNAPFDPVAYGATSSTVDHPAVQAFARRNVERTPDYYYGGGDAAVAREARRLFDLWRGSWSHNLIQADVDALIAEGRLMDFTHRWTRATGWQPIDPAPVVTADAVNDWSMRGMGHDAIDQGVCVQARCAREGVPVHCPTCDGHGERWHSPEAKAAAEAWKDIEPPTGNGWQMWETTSEGSPISPVFATPEELARWLADTGASSFGSNGASYDQWLAMINEGWAPTAIGDEKGLRSGVEFVGDHRNGLN